MTCNATRTAPAIVLGEEKPAAVVLEIKEYEKRLEDGKDLEMLRAMRNRPLKLSRLDQGISLAGSWLGPGVTARPDRRERDGERFTGSPGE